MRFLLLFFIVTGLVRSEELDDLLSTYTHNSDLSEKTKLENGGTVITYTRKDLDIMQVNYLKDLLKTHPVVRYKESRSGISDMFYRGANALFSSSNIRIYIDNQELTSATFGSGFTVANNLSMNAIDHVEIYTRSPSYEFSTEPTYILIKLYSKVASRDRGGKLELSYGSRGFNEESIFYADEFKDFSYVASVSRLEDKKREYQSHNIPIKRDSDGYTLFASLYNDEHKLQIMAGKADLDTSIGRSPLATLDKSMGHYEHLQVGYETSYIKDSLFSIAYQKSNIGGMSVESPAFDTYGISSVRFCRDEEIVSSEFKYDLETDNNRLIVGAKFRYKKFNIDHVMVNGIMFPKPNYDTQSVYTAFVEESYSLSDNNIINLAVQYAIVDNNGGIDDDDLLQLRLNHTYHYGNFFFKTFAYRIESLVEPYIYIDFPTLNSLDTQLLNALSEEIKYSFDSSDIRVVMTYGIVENLFIPTPSGGYINNPSKIKNVNSFIEYTNNFDIDNKLIVNLSYADIKNGNNKRKDLAGFVRLTNRVGKFDLFNEFLYNHNNIDHNNYYDYSAGVRYRYDKDLTLSIKGENIFNKGYKDIYSRVNPITGVSEAPVLIPPVEQRFYLTLEYLF